MELMGIHLHAIQNHAPLLVSQSASSMGATYKSLSWFTKPLVFTKTDTDRLCRFTETRPVRIKKSKFEQENQAVN
jgi:hypothetical protein